MREFSILIMVTAICGLATAASATNLIVNGGFGSPKVPRDEHLQIFHVGDKLPGWVVTGARRGDLGISLLGTKYSEENGALHFSPAGGRQSADLSGPSNVGAVGVKQTVPTTAGAAYRLSFYLGNQDDSYFNYPLPSSVEVFIGTASQGIFTNDDNTSNDLNWKAFSLTFTASSSKTTIKFVNRTEQGDNECGLDRVTLEPLQ
ncbi:MAG TPA: DUF642 domain-containing protein [Rhizomicrobium sp.]|jgi:hypothetical protein|nr:DUF642 domain-containing protein [Rhizomicrobium sp.]